MSPHDRRAGADGGQSAWTRALFDPDAPLPAGIAHSGDRPPVKRFAVYRNNVVSSLTDALGKAYPAVKSLVGEAFFTAMAGHFVRAHPPTTPVMLTYGDGFAAWLEGFEPAAHLAYLPDVARLERARLESYHAADAEPLIPERAQSAFEGRSPEEIAAARLEPHPALRLLDLSTPALAIWKAAIAGDRATVPSGRERIIVSRPVEQVVLRAAPVAAHAFVEALASGLPLVDAAAAATRHDANFDLSEALAGALRSGFFRDVRF